jgi:insertion element IS1 protein InsB
MIVREACPECGSNRCKQNGHTRHGKQNHQCQACERQLSAGADHLSIAHERRTLIANLLRERISLRGIWRAVGVSLTWLLHFMVECCAACPNHLHLQLPAKPTDVVMYQLEAEADARWSFVTKKANKLWLGLAMDAKSRQIMAFHVGDRSRASEGSGQNDVHAEHGMSMVALNRSLRSGKTPSFPTILTSSGSSGPL